MSSHKSKKRKVSHDQQSLRNGADPDTSKPTAVFVPTGGRSYTVSVALPGSIIANAQSHDQKTYLAGAIARALAVFCIDEVVIFEDDTKPRQNGGKGGGYHHDDDEADGYTAFSDPSHFLAHVLSFLETPPYMRKCLFPMHRNLRTAGALPSLDMPHHIRANEWCEYREGVTVQDESPGEGAASTTKKKKNKKQKQDSIAESSVTVIDTGLPQKVRLEGLSIPENTRVTVKFTSDHNPEEAKPVAPSAPREEAGYYWGYNVRRCSSLSTVFTECPFGGGYDLSFGTSERGVDISSILSSSSDTAQPVPKFQHMLIVFGGVAGIEAAVKADSELLATGVRPGEAEKLFDYWVNVLPGQGSRTIRTEEAVWLGLMGLRGVVRGNEGM